MKKGKQELRKPGKINKKFAIHPRTIYAIVLYLFYTAQRYARS